jgi:hypothetical protein
MKIIVELITFIMSLFAPNQEPLREFPHGNRGRKVDHTDTADHFVMIDGRLYRRFEK